jgi:hypothetical protein
MASARHARTWRSVEAVLAFSIHMGRALSAAVCIALSCACSARPGGGAAPADEAGSSSAGSDGARAPAGGSGPSAAQGGRVGEPSGPFQPPRELREVDSGYPLVVPSAGACPAGTAPSERFTCTDVPFCYCEHVCGAGCGAGEVCAPASDPSGAAACSCHAALEATEGGCVWRGLLADGSFDDAGAWRLYAESASGSASAEIAEGKLELRVTQRCSFAWAGSVARLPASTELPEGAALVVDYRAIGEASDREAIVSARLAATSVGPLDLSGRPAVLRTCAALTDYPTLALLELYIEVYGACADPVDVELSVDDVRLEADPSCGPRAR